VPASGATLDPSRLISTHHFGDEVGATVAITLYGLVLDCRGCGQPTTALLAFVPNGDPAWDRRWVVLCNTEASIAVADTALPEIARIVNAVGRPAYDGNQPTVLTNACFHCDAVITGDDLADVLADVETTTRRSLPIRHTAPRGADADSLLELISAAEDAYERLINEHVDYAELVLTRHIADRQRPAGA
jgi:hypothetical protein